MDDIYNEEEDKMVEITSYIVQFIICKHACLILQCDDSNTSMIDHTLPIEDL